MENNSIDKGIACFPYCQETADKLKSNQDRNSFVKAAGHDPQDPTHTGLSF